MIITDNHMHLHNHLKLEAVKQFKKAGGTHLILISNLAHHYGISPVNGKDFRKVFDIHISVVKEADEIVRAYPVIGVHPAEITILGEKIGYERASEVMKEGIEIAIDYIKEGRAVALKTGRPHYRVDEHIWKLSNGIMKHAFELAGDYDIPVQIHTESFTYEGMKEISEIARTSGLSPEKVVKHYSPPNVGEFAEIGIFPSVIAGKGVLKAVEENSRFVMETDYMDDSRRPGAVLGPRTVPKRVKEMMKMGVEEEVIWRICKDNIEKLYGIELDSS